MPRIGLVAAWLVVTAAATALTWAALSSADRQVGDSPAVLAATPTVSASPLDTPRSESTEPSETNSITAGSTPTTAAPAAATTTTTRRPATTTTTTTTTTAPPGDTTSSWSTLTVPSAGGVVVVRHRPEEVHLESATPSPGFVMEVDSTGPDEVRVEFEGVDSDPEIRVRWVDGTLDVEVRD